MPRYAMSMCAAPTATSDSDPAEELNRLRRLAARLVEQDRLSHEIARAYSQISERIYEFERERARRLQHR